MKTPDSETLKELKEKAEFDLDRLLLPFGCLLLPGIAFRDVGSGRPSV